MYDIIIVGLGSTGCQAAYHLVQAKAKNILLIDYGVPGVGSTTHEIISSKGDKNKYYPFCSGTNVFKSTPQSIKQIAILPPYDSVDQFTKHHGFEGVKKYVDMAIYGREQQKIIAEKHCPKTDYRQLGSMMVCRKGEQNELKYEFQNYKKLNINCRLVDNAELKKYHGPDTEFEEGILIPDDAIINSTNYCKILLDYLKQNSCTVIINSSPMKTCYTDLKDNVAKVVLNDGTTYTAKNGVLVCTGAYYLDHNLAGLMTPCFSYLSCLPVKSKPNSPNYFTLGFSHDWCIADNHFRVSGEDHFNGFLPPRQEERCNNLRKFIEDNYPSFIDKNQKGQDHWQTAYGRYSETVDHIPICGNVNDKSKIFYMLGCNAWGQASLSAVSTLAPGLLGYRKFNDNQLKFKDFINIRRFEVKFNDKNFQPKL